MWTTETTLSLIEMLHATPSLWDMTCSDYKNQGKKKDDIQRLANKYDVSFVDMDKKIHSLKTQFRREHKKVTDSKRSGFYPKKGFWFGYEPLLFLLRGSEPRGSQYTDDGTHEDTDDVPLVPLVAVQEEHGDLEHAARNETSTEDSVDCDDTPMFKSVCSRAAKRKADENKKIDEAYIIKAFVAQAARRDEYCVFGEHVANRLRRCGRSYHDLVIAQHKIENILFDLEMGAYDKNNYQQAQCHMLPKTECPDLYTLTKSNDSLSQISQNHSPSPLSPPNAEPLPSSTQSYHDYKN